MKRKKLSQDNIKTMITGFSHKPLVTCLLFAVSAISFSGCGQKPESPVISPAPEITNTTVDTPTPTSLDAILTPKPTPTVTSTTEETVPTPTLTLMPTPTNTPTPTPVFTFIPPKNHPEKSLSDFMSQEDIDTALSFAYNPDTIPQIFARYRGDLEQPYCYYCVDLIQVDRALCDMLIHIDIQTSAYRFEASPLQSLYYYVNASVFPDRGTGLFQTMDLNNDGYTDFLFNLGPMGNTGGEYNLCFIYDTNENSYVLLGEFSSANYIPEKQLIYERICNGMSGPYDIANKYSIDGTDAILLESIQDQGYYNNYTYQKLINGEMVTILENVSYAELSKLIDLTEWSEYAYLSLPIK